MKMKKTYFLIVLFLCGLSVGDAFAAAPAAGHLGQELIDAARTGNETKVERLIAREADVNAADPIGWTALMWAAREGHENIVETLLQVDGIDVNATNDIGYTALIEAAVWGYKNIVKMLLDAKADKDLQTRYGQTAEARARENDHEEIANIIRDYVRSGGRTKYAGKR